jgi:glyoxylase-like metal-dependent hydrolase (beta-lactamase superfamily II)
LQRIIVGFVATLLFLPMTTKVSAAPNASKDLRIVSVDVEGGAAVLFVTPEGKSLLIDTGWPPGMGGPRPVAGAPPAAPMPSSAERIAAAAASLGVTKIDYLMMTHYHLDHVGGLEALLAKLPVGAFIDHGPNREEPPANANPRQLGSAPVTLYPKWEAAYKDHEHITAEVGKTLSIGSMKLEFVTSDGHTPTAPLPGAGQPNPLCSGVAPMDRDGGQENVRAVGTLITFGKSRILYLGDLTWNKEIELLCPVNKIGKVDVYFVTGHGMDLSSSPPTGALAPLVAVMQNGPTKGGDKAVIDTVNTYPDLKGFWRTHYTVRYPELNGDPNYIANLEPLPDEGYFISLDITPGGEIVVTNSRNHFSKTYKARATH